MSEKYDLTAKVQPFLDDKLFELVKLFNENKEPLQDKSGEAITNFDGLSLEDAEKMFQEDKFDNCFQVLSHLSTTLDCASEEYEGLVWGKLAAKLLSGKDSDNVNGATKELKPEEHTTEDDKQELLNEPLLREVEALREVVENNRSAPALEQLNKKTWLLHWSLFAYFRGHRLAKLVDCFTQSNNMSAIQYSSPWLLRYLVIAVVITHNPTTRYNRKIRDVVRFVSQESYEYNDPVLDLFQTLYVDNSFDSINIQLKNVAELLKTDYFAHPFVNQFVENFRVLVSDLYFRVHLTVDTAELAKILDLESGEKEWFKKYMSRKADAKLEVTYDEEKGVASATYNKPTVSAQIAEKLRFLEQKASA